jgi:hypothetical protein
MRYTDDSALPKLTEEMLRDALSRAQPCTVLRYEIHPTRGFPGRTLPTWT